MNESICTDTRGLPRYGIPAVIRRATVADVDRIVQMGERFIATTTYRDLIVPHPPSMALFVEALLSGKVGLDSVIFVDDRGGELVGMIGLFAYIHPMSNQLEAIECFWWQEPEHRGSGVRLLRAAEAWAKEARAVTLRMIAPTPAVERLYERLNYRRVEASYARGL